MTDIDMICDDREDPRLIRKLLAKGLSLSQERLGVGDYVWNGIAVERKSLSDLLKSVKVESNQNGSRTGKPRIWRQAQGLSDNFDKAVVIIHDTENDLNNYDSKYYNRKKILGVISGLELGFGIYVDWVKDEDEFIDMLLSHWRRGRKGIERPYPSTPSGTPLKERIENALCQSRLVGVKTAKKVLSDYNSFKNLSNANLEELQDKYGEKTGKYIYDLFNTEINYD